MVSEESNLKRLYSALFLKRKNYKKPISADWGRDLRDVITKGNTRDPFADGIFLYLN